ncbi:LrgB family protein [Neptunomonas qingdaonensis]|uniref:TIGR00659 family protein n=1 Tax=Neptunomonas qingdaonensis TaxID=1045558 RepID=A0A1I2TEF6_9GAMM|nr:LrgB family protein [Neptunomonas qingdaonensis]SFG63333.1 TIGR00659 family protein [Neptunomonas qingdaonensis]
MEFWVYFAAKPLFWLIVTLAVFMFATALNKRSGGTPLLHPVLVAMAIIITFLLLTKTSYETYFEGAQFIHFLLGPATVALAVPLFDHFERIKTMWLVLLVACVTGAVSAIVSVLLVGLLFDLPTGVLLSLAPKSVTSPIAIGIVEKIGGFPSLAAGLVLITGAMGCLLSPLIFKLLGVKDDAVKGFSLGLSAHGFGTAYAFEVSAVAGAFAGLAMGMTGLLTAFLLPVVISLMGLI